MMRVRNDEGETQPGSLGETLTIKKGRLGCFGHRNRVQAKGNPVPHGDF